MHAVAVTLRGPSPERKPPTLRDSPGLNAIIIGMVNTHYIGVATLQAHQPIADETVRIVLEFAASGMVLNAVG